jgi:hypothetical protein
MMLTFLTYEIAMEIAVSLSEQFEADQILDFFRDGANQLIHERRFNNEICVKSSEKEYSLLR